MKLTECTLVVLGALASGVALAHPGHGDPAPLHWHAGDTWGWALALAVAGLAWWRLRK